MTLTVIIPTLDRQDYVIKLLQSLEKQTISDFEVLVIDQSDYNSSELEHYHSQHFSYTYFHLQVKGLPNARNVGAKHASGSFLVFFDDTIIPAENLLQEYIRLFKNMEHVWVIGANIKDTDPKIMSESNKLIGGKITWYGKTKKNFNSPARGYCDWVAGGNFGTRKDKYLLVGGFDVNFIGNALFEDCDYCYMIKKHGGTIFYSGQLQSKHLRLSTGGVHCYSHEQVLYFRVRNTLYFFRKHGQKRYIPFSLVYLFGIYLKELFGKMIGMGAFTYLLHGIRDGLLIPISKQ